MLKERVEKTVMILCKDYRESGLFVGDWVKRVQDRDHFAMVLQKAGFDDKERAFALKYQKVIIWGAMGYCILQR